MGKGEGCFGELCCSEEQAGNKTAVEGPREDRAVELTALIIKQGVQTAAAGRTEQVSLRAQMEAAGSKGSTMHNTGGISR